MSDIDERIDDITFRFDRLFRECEAANDFTLVDEVMDALDTSQFDVYECVAALVSTRPMGYDSEARTRLQRRIRARLEELVHADRVASLMRGFE